MGEYINRRKLVERLKVSPMFPNYGAIGELLREGVIDLIENFPEDETPGEKKINKLAIGILEKLIARVKSHGAAATFLTQAQIDSIEIALDALKRENGGESK